MPSMPRWRRRRCSPWSSRNRRGSAATDSCSMRRAGDRRSSPSTARAIRPRPRRPTGISSGASPRSRCTGPMPSPSPVSSMPGRGSPPITAPAGSTSCCSRPSAMPRKASWCMTASPSTGRARPSAWQGIPMPRASSCPRAARPGPASGFASRSSPRPCAPSRPRGATASITARSPRRWWPISTASAASIASMISPSSRAPMSSRSRAAIAASMSIRCRRTTRG